MKKQSYTNEEKKRVSGIVLSDYGKQYLISGDLPEYFKQKKWQERFETIEDYECYLKICQMKATEDF